ncbi:MAG: alpha-amylase family glycosyl hydrolase [Bacteroidota bacterium]|jgi:glycosidase
MHYISRGIARNCKHDSTQRLEFHISRRARDEFLFEDTFFSIQGDLVLSNLRAAQMFAERINQQRRTKGAGTVEQVLPSEIYAMGLLHEILHFVIDRYRQERNPDFLPKCDHDLKTGLGAHAFDDLLKTFTAEFPPLPVYKKDESPAEYLRGTSGTVTNRQIALEELLLVWLQNRNPAFQSIIELVDDSELAERTAYDDAIHKTKTFFGTQPGYGPANQPLIDMLLAPAAASPDSIMGQLEFIRTHWVSILSGSQLMMKLLGAMDFIREEGKYLLMRAQAEADRAKKPTLGQLNKFGIGDKESAIVPSFTGPLYEFEPERFSTDLEWMPRLVLIAKNIFVWLDQLSKRYQRHISRLDEIPDGELDILAQRGITGLWLIGIWQRSRASERVKKFSGNPEALASAYSLLDYDIAPELGGEEAFYRLRDQAFRRGIRLASDMVPNHMGIDSSWVINHPDWFVQSDYPPFPNYTFTGPDLSDNDRVGIFIEDGYWRKTDAAVVFKRLDRWTGDVKYVYHGNDGTHMPWNDTAQLNFLRSDVREAVIQTILHVARLFPVIRFDAAMTLAKKHFQRLWFPEPGTGGAIPSRASFSMTRAQLDALMPQEFWREVVDRVQQETPNTLLLAEAFWLMEGYFVRTLGMHRVYNSAFMNMLKKEENANYRSVMKNVLEFNPQILRRFVNFMNNPDEETAVAQFGKDDKYFGVCILMVTLPGLPMFGHGQVEGYGEKYGMEYRRAYYDEQPDRHLVARHEREIFPLVKKRYLFADVDSFLLYDFFTKEGIVNEDVFAYSNRTNDERSLVVYNNRFTHTAGWIMTSVGFAGPGGKLVQRQLSDGLALNNKRGMYSIFRDAISGLEYIRSVNELRHQGLYIELGAFKYHVFLDFREVESTKDAPYDLLASSLNGQGVPSVGEALLDMRLNPIHTAIREALSPERLRFLKAGWKDGRVTSEAITSFDESIRSIAHSAAEVEHVPLISDDVTQKARKEFTAFQKMVHCAEQDPKKESWQEFILQRFPEQDAQDLDGWRTILSWIVLSHVRESIFRKNDRQESLLDLWRLAKPLVYSFVRSGIDEDQADRELYLLTALERLPALQDAALIPTVEFSLVDPYVKEFLRVNRWDNVLWFNKERFEELLGWIFILSAVQTFTSNDQSIIDAKKKAGVQFSSYNSMLRNAEQSKYQVEGFLGMCSAINPGDPVGGPGA